MVGWSAVYEAINNVMSASSCKNLKFFIDPVAHRPTYCRTLDKYRTCYWWSQPWPLLNDELDRSSLHKTEPTNHVWIRYSTLAASVSLSDRFCQAVYTYGTIGYVFDVCFQVYVGYIKYHVSERFLSTIFAFVFSLLWSCYVSELLVNVLFNCIYCSRLASPLYVTWHLIIGLCSTFFMIYIHGESNWSPARSSLTS